MAKNGSNYDEMYAEDERCPHCHSRHPHLHPSVQCEGEVEICTHDFHLTPTPQNTPEYIAGVLAKRASR